MPATMTIARFPCTDVRFSDVMALRKAVFETEQGVPEAVDATDAIAVHMGLYQGRTLMATARLYPAGSTAAFRDTLKIGRVAVSQSQRGTGLGKTLMQAVLQYAAQAGWKKATLNGQAYASPFYTKLGFKQLGPMFLEEGIDHYRFDLDLMTWMPPKTKTTCMASV